MPCAFFDMIVSEPMTAGGGYFLPVDAIVPMITMYDVEMQQKNNAINDVDWLSIHHRWSLIENHDPSLSTSPCAHTRVSISIYEGTTVWPPHEDSHIQIGILSLVSSHIHVASRKSTPPLGVAHGRW